MKILRESLPEIIGGLVVAAVLATLGALSGVLDLERNTQLLNKAIILVWYLLIWIAAIFAFRAKRQSKVEPSVTFPRFSKYVKVFAVIVVGAATFSVVWAFSPFKLHDLRIRLVNSTDHDVSLSRRADFWLMLDVPAAEDRIITTGRLHLQTESPSGKAPYSFVVPAGKALEVRGQFISPSKYRPYLEMDGTFVILHILDENGRLVKISDEGIYFNQEALESSVLEVTLPQGR